MLLLGLWERSDSVVECLTRDLGVADLSLTDCTVLCPSARHINACLVLVQPRKTHPDITIKLLNGMLGRKESNQTKKYSGILLFEKVTIYWFPFKKGINKGTYNIQGQVKFDHLTVFKE